MQPSNNLLRILKRDRGFHYKPYKDFDGTLIIGCGHNLDDNPLSDRLMQRINAGGELTDREIDDILADDLREAIRETLDVFGVYWGELTDARKDVLIHIAFDLGKGGISDLKLMIAGIANHDWIEASKQMLNSCWARQSSARAIRLSKVMETDDESYFEV